MPCSLSRRLAVLSALALSFCVAASVPAVAQALQTISGHYTAHGRNPDGSAYNGSVQITESNGAVSMAWQVGNQSYIGTGTRDGAIVSVDWGSDAPVIYVVMTDGTMHGTWAHGTALEKLTPR